ncbi:MAG: NPCBM/NEW2 domain-containing protein [Bacteroidales bacterium]|nr:NPCBM/NEW2 domain-containing protein [Bacteroidales bacterium]
MKRLLTLLLVSFLGVSVYAQTFLVNNLKPVDQKHYNVQDSPFSIGGYMFNNSFYLNAPDGGLISSQEQSFATFELKKQYNKLSFVYGPAIANPNGDNGNAFFVMLADGKTILDVVVNDHDAPHFVTLDVAGVDKITFKNVRGSEKIGIGEPKLWKTGQNVVVAANPLDKLPKGKVKLVQQLKPYFTSGNMVKQITDDQDVFWDNRVGSISINRKTFDFGLQMYTPDGLIEDSEGWSYFWLNKRYDKVSFIVGPRDNQSSNSSAWLVVKADGRTIYEEYIRQSDIAQQVVLDVKGKEQLSFYCQRRSGDLLGSMTFGVVDIYAYPEGYATSLPEEGAVNLNKDKIAALPDMCPLMSNIRPFSVRGFNDAYDTMFYGETRHYGFYMGGISYWEGMLFTTGNTLMNDMIDSYAEFDLAGEFDYISFDIGCLSKRHVMDDDRFRIYADGKLVFDSMIYCTWPNQHYEVPIYKCRTLRFEKPGNGKQKQTIIGVGDVILYRGRPAPNDIFVHEMPDFPYETDLIDLCGKPYFHYCGRFVSSITNFSMDDCFHDGSSKRNAFNMKDGSQIYKGFMLETNIPLGMEEITPISALFMFMTGAGVNISNSDVSATTGTTAGVSGPLMGGIGLLLADKDNKQSSAAAFNPFGEYESCTFTVANAYEHVDEFEGLLNSNNPETAKNPVKLNVFADQRLVGEYWLDNKMEPMTITVPIFKCQQLMFWLECGDQRSGQYVFYNLSVSKAPCHISIPETYTSGQTSLSKDGKSKEVKGKGEDSGKSKKEKKVVSEEEKQARREKAAKAVGVGLDILGTILQ